MAEDFKQIYSMYDALKSEREKYRPRWNDVSKFTGISVEPDYLWNNRGSKSDDLDEYVDDPTSSICVNQFGDCLIGIMWGTGDKVFDLIPSRYVLEIATESELEDYYSFITGQTLYHMNHPDAGYHNALQPYAYDQASFGTSGIGTFPNKAFLNKVADNALVFRSYGIDNSCIDEGKAGAIDIGFVTYHWRVNRIVSEFCTKDGIIDDKSIARLPKRIKKAWDKGQLNDEFDIIFGFFPRSDFNPRFQGKRGTRYRGVWFMDEGATPKENIFHEEDFAERPISFARMIKVRGEIYGRSSGTMLLSTIRSVNYMVANSIEIMEKMGNPSLGVLNNALFGDSVLDTSPEGLTVFNSALAAGSNPVFPIHEVGDPSAIIQFLIPYLNDKITSAFKVDALLDFNSAKVMTAAESLQRYAIRGKSLSGILIQQKNERLVPDVRRSVSILYNMNELGVNPDKYEDAAKSLKDAGKEERIIPDAVLKVIADGKPWYDIRWNNELEKLTRTEVVQNLVQLLQSIGGIAGMYPQIVAAVDWYKMLEDINRNLNANNQILVSAEQFKAIIEQQAQQQQAALMLQAGQAGAQISKDTSQANKNNTEASNGR